MDLRQMKLLTGECGSWRERGASSDGLFRWHIGHYLPSPTALCPSTGRAIEVTRCAITRCREIMTPQLSIVKTRFAKASLRPRCARHRSWGATCLFPNACVGHSATQCLRGILTYPMLAWVVKLPTERYRSSGRSTTGGEFAQTWFTWSRYALTTRSSGPTRCPA